MFFKKIGFKILLICVLLSTTHAPATHHVAFHAHSMAQNTTRNETHSHLLINKSVDVGIFVGYCASIAHTLMAFGAYQLLKGEHRWRKYVGGALLGCIVLDSIALLNDTALHKKKVNEKK